MSDETFISYAQNGEDVVLWRALGHVTDGRYVDVGACDPVDLSVTKAFYDRGWRGIDIDAVPEYAERLRDARPGNEVVHAAITDRDVDTVTFHQVVDTGLSTLLGETADEHERAGFARREISVPAVTLDEVCEASSLLGGEIHLLKVDVEGAEAEVLRSFDLRRWRPWVVVVEATRPLTTEPSFEDWDPLLTDAGYTFTLFDGLSRFYVSDEHTDLIDRLSYPACALDDYKRFEQVTVEEQLVHAHEQAEQAAAEVNVWRNRSVGFWAEAVARAQESENNARIAARDAQRLQAQIKRLRTRLEAVQAERRRLRNKTQRLETRVESLQARVDQHERRFEARARRKVRGMLGRDS